MKILTRLSLLFLFVFGWRASAEFKVLDQICAIVDSEQPILLSEVKNKASQLSKSEQDAMNELIHERLLRIYARQLKFSTTDTARAAQDHVQTIMKNNQLSREKFQEILRAAPYNTTLEQYEYDISFQMLKGQLEASFSGSINISEKDIEAAFQESNKNASKRYEVAFVSVLAPNPSAASKKIDRPAVLTEQLNTAKIIKESFLSESNIDVLKQKYMDRKDVSVIGPIDYEPGSLKKKYEAVLRKDPSLMISEPFEDGGAVVMIIKIAKRDSETRVTALENVRKDLYKKAVEQRLHAATNDLLIDVPVKVNCSGDSGR